MSHSQENESAQWKKLIELGIFDDFYPQRLNACFRYLDVDKLQCFSLKDLMQKGVFVFNYLSLDIEHESTFAIMDIFRTFDRSGSGAVNIEEFVIGMIEKLYGLYKNTALLTAIAEEVLGIENRSAELAARIDKEATSSEKLHLFRLHLRALLYLIRDRLRNPPKGAAYAVNLSAADLGGIFQDSILQAIRDSIAYFHVSNERLSGVSLEYEALVGSAPTPGSAEHAGAESLLYYAQSVWNLAGPRVQATGHLLGSAAAAAGVGLLPAYESAQGAGAGGGAVSASAPGGPPQSGLLAATAGHGPGTGLRATSPYMELQLSEGEEDAQKGVTGLNVRTGGGRKRSILALNDPQNLYDSLAPPPNLVSLGLEPEALEALSGLAANQGAVDSSQLYLLQAAFRSLESFFNLADSNTPSPDGPAHAQSGNAAAPLATPKAVGNQSVVASIAKSTELRKNDDYLVAEGAAGVKEPAVPILASGFEFDLAQSLLEAQEALRKTRMRMDVLEMVQEEAMLSGQSVALDEEDDSRLLTGDSAGNNLQRDFLHEGREGTSTSAADESKGEVRVMTEEDIIQEVNGKYSPEHTSFEGIMSELSALRVCLSERASVDYPLGNLLDRNVAIVPLDKGRPSAPAGSKRSETTEALPGVLKSMTEATKELLEIVKVKTQANSASQTLLNTLRQQEEKLAEYRSSLEQAEVAKNEFTSLTVELQVLRERVQRHAKDEGQLNLLTVKNLELQKHVKELEEQLGDHKSRRKDTAESKADNKKIHDLRTVNQQLELQRNAHVAAAERLTKENTRVRAAMAIAEQRVKGALQDQMALHHQLQQLEEDNMNAKATITKLTREMEDYKVSRGQREDADRRISELQREIHKRDVELAEAREEASQALKYQNELQVAEQTIEHLEMNVSEMSVELEKGAVAMMQLESYREQLRVKTKENRDMSLHIHGLENQLKDVPYLQTRYQEVLEELEDCKMKIEKLPALLSEQARLRGSSRASVKALQEHDKTLSHYKNRVKQLERETAILKNDNRAMQELEAKLKESNQEIKRLLTAIAEGNNPTAVKAGAAGGSGVGGLPLSPTGVPGTRPMFSAEEDKKRVNTNDGQYRKMRTRIRQSIAMSGMTGTAGLSAAVAASMNNNNSSS